MSPGANPGAARAARRNAGQCLRCGKPAAKPRRFTEAFLRRLAQGDGTDFEYSLVLKQDWNRGDPIPPYERLAFGPGAPNARPYGTRKPKSSAGSGAAETKSERDGASGTTGRWRRQVPVVREAPGQGNDEQDDSDALQQMPRQDAGSQGSTRTRTNEMTTNGEKSEAPIYAMRNRPVAGCTLPPGITTDWVRLPQLDGHTMRRAFPDRETSRTRLFGEFTTNRPLTSDELERYEIDRIDAPFLRSVTISQIREKVGKLKAEREVVQEDLTTIEGEIAKAEAELKTLAGDDADTRHPG